MEDLTRIIDLFENNFKNEQEYSNKEIKAFLEENGIGKNDDNPSSFTYNRVNHGTKYFLPLFDRITRGKYIYKGPNSNYNGDLYHDPNGENEIIHVGSWNNGKLNLLGPIPKNLSKEKIQDNLVQIITYDPSK